jgi:glutathione synthase/RimK-type ligase-like ATP-grasp enzyme
MKAGKVLAICCRPENHDDFVAIGKRIIRKAPEIAVVIKPVFYHPNELDPALQNFPLLNLYLVNPPQVIPSRGKTLFVERIDKFEQIKQYAAAGIATPKTIEYELDQPINKNDWGEHVFIKPRKGSFSKNSFLIPTKYILDIKPYFEEVAPKEKFILQQFINTGVNATSYRVLNFFGEALSFCSLTCPKPIYLPNNLDEAFNNDTVQTNLENANAIRKLEYDNEILNFSKKTFNVFNDKPIQGTDIIIDTKSNKLLVLEANLGGNSWVFTKENWGAYKQLGRPALLQQFNAFDVAADVLIKKTEELAI